MALYHWIPTECAPAQYPAELLMGELELADGSTLYIPDGRTIFNGWGAVGSTHIVGDDLKALPETLSVLWYSLTEDSFYEGVFDLPASRIAAFLEQGFYHPLDGERQTYRRLSVGLAPGGDVSLWLTTGAVTREVAGFTAQPAPLNWAEFDPMPGMSRSDYINQCWAELRGGEAAARAAPPRPGQWGQWRDRFHWSAYITGPGTPQMLWISSLNGEKEIYDLADWQDDWPNRAAPALIRLRWTGPNGTEYAAKITFDPDESYQAFRRFAEARTDDRPIALLIELGDTPRQISLALRDAQLFLPLRNCQVEVFRR